MLYTAIRLNHVTNKSINSTIYIDTWSIMKLDEQITPGYSSSYPQREDRPARADLKKLQRLTETNQVPPLVDIMGEENPMISWFSVILGRSPMVFFWDFHGFQFFFCFFQMWERNPCFFQDFPSTKQNPQRFSKWEMYAMIFTTGKFQWFSIVGASVR